MKLEHHLIRLTGKFQILLTVLSAVILTSSVNAEWHTDYSALLGKYVNSKGVKYKAWKASSEDVAKLHAVTDAIATEKPSGGPEGELAFYLNAYNAWILRAAIDNYPTKSIMDVKKDFFKTYPILVSGKKISFDVLENEIIRKKFKEPRIHFAVNCASGSCPPLHNEIFEAKTLDETLTKLTKDFVNSPTGVRISYGKPQVSKIFEWFKADFGDVTAFINEYRSRKVRGNLSYQDYVWTLNEVK